MAKFPIKSFEPHGYYCIDSSLIEVQFNHTNEAARYRITTFNYVTGENTIHVGYWQPIRYDKSCRPYLKDWHGNVSSGAPARKHKPLYLDNFMRTNNKF